MQEVRKFLAKKGLEATLRPAVPVDAGSIVRTIESASMEEVYLFDDLDSSTFCAILLL